MAKYHINSNGDVKPCTATKVSCQFGDESLHFDRPEAAQKFVEETLGTTLGDKSLRGKKRTRDALVAPKHAPTTLDGLMEKAYGKKAPSASKKPANQTSSQLTTQLNHGDVTLKRQGFTKLSRTPELPVVKAIEASILRQLPGAGKPVAFYKNAIGDYRALVQQDDAVFMVGPGSTKDIPLYPRSFEAWESSFHPSGPKATISCSTCYHSFQSRMGNFGRAQGRPAIRCPRCGQLNGTPAGLTYG